MSEIPKLKRDWVGRRVRTRRELRSGMMQIPADTILTVESNRSGLTLSTQPCEHCGVRIFVRRVPESDVELLPRG